MPTYEIEFEQGGKTMIMDIEGERPPTEEEARGLVQQHLSQGQETGPAMGQQVGRLPSGKPIVQNPGGDYSTHRNAIVEINGQQAVIPTMFGGREVTVDDAIKKVMESGMKDPDTGEAIQTFPTLDAAEQYEKTYRQNQRLDDSAFIQSLVQKPTTPQTSIGPMLYGAVQGASDLLGGAVDLVKTGVEAGVSRLPDVVANPLRALTYGEEAVTAPPVSKQLEEGAKALLTKVGIPSEDLDPDTRTEQFIQRVVREVTGTAVGLPAVRALSATARAMPLGRAAAAELAMGTAQGVGAATAQQVLPGNLPAEIAGQLAPNVVGLVRSLSKNLGTRLVPDPDMLRTQVTQALAETTGDLGEAGQNLQRTLDIQNLTPGLQPTLPEALGSPGLISLQRSQRAADPTLAARLTERRSQNIDAATDTLDDLFKGGDAEDIRRSLGQTQKRVEARLAQRSQKAQQRLAQAQQSTEARAAKAQARINERITKAQGDIRDRTATLARDDVEALDAKEIASAQTRRLYEDARRTFRTESRRLYENVDPDNAVTGRVGDLADQADNIASRALLSFDERDLPASLRDFQRSIKARASQPIRSADGPLPPAGSSVPDDQLELQQFIRRQGGINLSGETDIAGEFEALVRNRESGTTGLFRVSGGLTPAQMAERAQEAGFTFEADKFELLDAIRESMKTGKTYSVRNSTAFGDPIDEAYFMADTTEVLPDSLRDVDVSLSDLQRLRSHILRDARGQTGPDAANKRRLLHQFRQSVESRMESLAREQGRDDVFARLQQANRFYRQNINKFSTGAGERILRQRNGTYQVSNAQVIREFLKTPEDAAQFVDGIGSRDDALEAIESYLDADFYLRAVTPETGRVNASKARQFLRERNPMLRLFPELRERYSDIGALELKAQRVEDAGKRLSQRATRRVSESEELLDAQERAANVQASVARQEQRIAREPGQVILKDTLDNGGIAQIMGRSDANHHLIRLADTMSDNPEARSAIPRTMWQEFLRREGQRAGRDPITDNPMLNEKYMSNFITRYSGVLNHVYGAEHVANLKKVAKGLGVARAADRPPVQMGSPTAELLQGQNTFLKGAARASMPISMPVASLKLRLLRFAGRSALNYIQTKKEEALRTITQEILYDPDISKTFAMLQNAKTGKAAGIRLKAHMLMLGAENRFDDPEDDG